MENTRKSLKWHKRVARFHIVVAAALFVLIPKFYAQTRDFIDNMPDDNFRKHAWSGLVFGVVTGLGFVVYISQAVQAMVMGFDFLSLNRKDKLLIKYHDLLKQVAEKRMTGEQLDSPDAAPSTPSDEPPT